MTKGRIRFFIAARTVALALTASLAHARGVSTLGDEKDGGSIALGGDKDGGSIALGGDKDGGSIALVGDKDGG